MTDIVSSQPRGTDSPLDAATIETHIRTAVGESLGIPAHKIDTDRSLISLGFDSLMAINLQHRIESSLGLSLSIMDLLAGATIAEMAEALAEAMGDSDVAGQGGKALEPLGDEQGGKTLNPLRNGQEDETSEPLRNGQESSKTSEPTRNGQKGSKASGPIRSGQRGKVLEPLWSGPRPERLPLSFAQQRLWFLDQLTPNSTVYTVAGTITLTGPLNTDALTHALTAITTRHETLRTTFPTDDTGPYQHIHPPHPHPLPYTDLTHPAHPANPADPADPADPTDQTTLADRIDRATDHASLANGANPATDQTDLADRTHWATGQTDLADRTHWATGQTDLADRTHWASQTADSTNRITQNGHASQANQTDLANHTDLASQADQINPADQSGDPIGDDPARDRLARLIAEETARPFDLATGPLLRTHLAKTGPTTHHLIIT
ncbi:condensation domain-containing protein, partial [Streptosporangium sp. NPDC000396]|uniref:condensation domain-containing protein n=1 Tax=Streptosporangium sp. NPDC000396 TaxID=3366185 RepID=UPI00369447D0